MKSEQLTTWRRRARDTWYFRARGRKVDFVVGGTQKGGTTALDRYLRSHPDLVMPFTRKELHFFDTDHLFRDGRPDYSIYHGNFDRRQLRGRMLGEATPIYMYWSPVPARIHRYNPRMKWVLVLRDPVSRAYSHWNMRRNGGKETRTFLAALRDEIDDRADDIAVPTDRTGYIARGFYGRQIEAIFRYFSRQQVHVVKSESLKSQPEAVLRRLCRFLGVGNFPSIRRREVHAIPYPEPMDERARALLLAVYRDEIRRLEAMLDWDCRDWLQET